MKTGIFLFVLLCCVGCGGSGVSDPGQPIPAKYVGQFHASFIGASGDRGTMALTISPHGNISGTVKDQTSGAPGDVRGKIDPSLHCDLDLEFHNGVGHLSGQITAGPGDGFSSKMTESGLVNQIVTVTVFPGP